MGIIESRFPWPVQPIDISDDDENNGENKNDENETKNRNLVGGSTDNLIQDFQIFKKYLKMEIQKELAANNSAVGYDDNQDELEAIKEQVQKDHYMYVHMLKNESEKK